MRISDWSSDVCSSDLIERFDIAVPGGNRVCSVRIALPASYTAAKARKRRYPLLVVFDAQMCFGSAVEMSRLMSETEEIHDCIIAGIDTVAADFEHPAGARSEEHTSELQSLMRISYAVFC